MGTEGQGQPLPPECSLGKGGSSASSFTALIFAPCVPLWLHVFVLEGKLLAQCSPEQLFRSCFLLQHKILVQATEFSHKPCSLAYIIGIRPQGIFTDLMNFVGLLAQSCLSRGRWKQLRFLQIKPPAHNAVREPTCPYVTAFTWCCLRPL